MFPGCRSALRENTAPEPCLKRPAAADRPRISWGRESRATHGDRSAARRRNRRAPKSNLTRSREQHHAADRFAGMHQLECAVDVVQWHCVRDEIIDVDLAVHVPIDDL